MEVYKLTHFSQKRKVQVSFFSYSFFPEKASFFLQIVSSTLHFLLDPSASLPLPPQKNCALYRGRKREKSLNGRRRRNMRPGKTFCSKRSREGGKLKTSFPSLFGWWGNPFSSLLSPSPFSLSPLPFCAESSLRYFLV